MINAKWTVGGGLRYYKEIYQYLKKKKETYNLKHHLVDSVYDSPHGLIWNGGREPVFSNLCLDDYIEMIDSYNKEGIGFYFTFSNVLIRKRHLSNDLCNYVLKKTEREMNGVIVSSEKLRAYIKKEYPKFQIKASVCKVDRNYKKLLNKHDIVVLQHGDNKNYNLIKRLGKDVSRVEVLVNETCPPFCPYQKMHNEGISKRNIESIYIHKHKNVVGCYVKVLKVEGEFENVLNFKDIENLYNLGIRNFKIQGRDISPQFVVNEMEKYIEKPLFQKNNK